MGRELEKTVVSSLATSFGLDFLLFEDKLGGNVNTIHNVRQGIYATDEAKQAYEDRGAYDNRAYHSHDKYKDRGNKDKNDLVDGKLFDAYRQKVMAGNEGRHLDHIIYAKSIHDDHGRVLAGLDGVELANVDSNLQSTFWFINNQKSAMTMKEFVDGLDGRIANVEANLRGNQEKLASLPRGYPTAAACCEAA